MKIEIKKFFYEQFVELAKDDENGTCLLGIPFDVGGAGHVNYFVISKLEFDMGMSDPTSLSAIEKNGAFIGSGRLYWSSYVASDGLNSCES